MMGSRSRSRPPFTARRLLICSAILLTAALACAFPSPADPTPVDFVIQGTRALTDDYTYYRSPAWSPDGRLIAALRSQTYPEPRGPSSEGDVVLFDLDSGERQVIAAPPTVKPQGAYDPVLWKPDGEGIAFYYFEFLAEQKDPYLVTYHPETGEMTTIDFCRCSQITLSREGTEVLVVDSPEGTFQLSWFNLGTGEMRTEISIAKRDPQEHRYRDFSLSPDGRTLLLGDRQGSLFWYEIGSGEAPEHFLSLAASPAWSPDGTLLVYVQLLSASTLDYYSAQLVIADSDGSSPEPLFPETQPGGMLSPAWSPDGTQIAFRYGSRNSNVLLIAEVPERLRP